MRILALEIERTNAPQPELRALLIEEAKSVWRLYQEGVIREAFFRADRSAAVLILECASAAEAKQRLSQLPLVSAGVIDFDVIPLVPYSGFARLFSD